MEVATFAAQDAFVPTHARRDWCHARSWRPDSDNSRVASGCSCWVRVHNARWRHIPGPPDAVGGVINDDEAHRAARAFSKVQLGELSAARQALEGAAVAPGTLATLAALTNPEKRPPVPRQPISPHLAQILTR